MKSVLMMLLALAIGADAMLGGCKGDEPESDVIVVSDSRPERPDVPELTADETEVVDEPAHEVAEPGEEPEPVELSSGADTLEAHVLEDDGGPGHEPEPPEPAHKVGDDEGAGHDDDGPHEPEPEEEAGLVIVGTVEIASHIPAPGSVPYTECVTFVKYRVSEVVSGEYGEPELLAVFWGMRDNKLEPAAKFAKGQRHRMTLVPFDDKPDLTGVMQADDTEEYGLPAYWAESYSGA